MLRQKRSAMDGATTGRFGRLLALLLVLVLSACGCSDQEAAVRATTAEAIDALAAGEAFTSNDYYPLLPDERLSGLSATHEPVYKVCATALERMSYELGEVVIEGNTATVEVTVTCPDLYVALERAQGDVAAYASSPEGLREIEVREDVNQRARYLCDWLLVYLSEHLADGDIETRSFTAPAYLTRSGGSWQLDYAESPELLAALFCVEP